MTNNWEDFPNQSMGVTEIDGMNEKDEMELTDVRDTFSFSTLNTFGKFSLILELHGRLGIRS